MTEFEERFWREGLIVAGVDEAGRGSLAGPVVAAAVIIKPGTEPFLTSDSKKLTPQQRENFYEEIKNRSLAIGTGVVDSALIDRINILEATKVAMRRALEDLSHKFDLVITDYVRLDGYQCLALKKGDERSLSCACASIVAKVLRDRIMEEYHRLFPDYGFDRHKGYPTNYHRRAININGPTDIHRRSFKL